MTALPWFRMYSSFASDPVIQSLSFEDQRHYAVVLCMKCDGLLDRKVAPRVRERLIAGGLGLDPVAAQEAKRRLMEVGLLQKNWQPKGWEKRQYQSDVSTERVRKYRKTKETGNVTETLPKRSETVSETDQNRSEQIPPYSPPLTSGGRGSRLPPDWSLPDDWRAWAESEGLTRAAIDRQAEQFADYWHGAAGAKGRKADWFATWRNWIRRDLPEPAKRSRGLVV